MNTTNKSSNIDDDENMIKNWENSLISESSQYMDELVMDYFISEGLYDEAEAFNKETGIEIIDKKQLVNRNQIINLLYEGNIDEVMSLLNNNYNYIHDDNTLKNDTFMNRHVDIYCELIILKFCIILKNNYQFTITSNSNNNALLFAQKEFPKLIQLFPPILASIEKVMSILILLPTSTTTSSTYNNNHVNDNKLVDFYSNISSIISNKTSFLVDSINSQLLLLQHRPKTCQLRRLVHDMDELQIELLKNHKIPQIDLS